MSLLKTSTRWPLYLGIAGMVVVLVSVWYTNNLATQLSEIEHRQLRMANTATERLNLLTLDDTGDDVSMELDILDAMETVPTILVSMDGHIDAFYNMGTVDTGRVKAQLKQWIDNGSVPIRQDVQLIYYGESRLLVQLRYFPVVLLLLVSTFILLGYIGLNQSRRAEQNLVWVGMAKETAHQLGTPISAILGWVEHLKMMYGDNEDLMEVSDELGRDVNRLSMVANRFSKIGATPELVPTNIFEEMDKCREYMEKRAPRKVKFNFPAADAGNLMVGINPLLFDWVIENLLRNALDAMDGSGEISALISENGGKVFIDITDTGKGIAAKNIRKVFNPGFTTKQRGWGLGLSLVRRIIHEYHNGKIQVSRSAPGVGTTFTISLPKV
ncbi:PAS domain-containing sensor histidine kinase [Lewinella sp. 4G2]|uniref:sensor histidine kinase n=1 Tax=Lewinella sp. 4G2 TaxID=1803372 RepID=UPI0007B4B4AE|nr:HAMP domain-containing sensor histidine kinase [Lewinella sp. 4G2]OAV43038.1 two-component sensor histidine kinase [Lewinella sp. 4G2]